MSPREPLYNQGLLKTVPKFQQKPIYLDYAATTPVDPRVAEKMQECLLQSGVFGNPSSNHFYGEEANQIITEAREHLSALIHCQPHEIVWTSGATESINLALKGMANFYGHKRRHVVTFQTEHKTVLEVCQFLQKQGFEVSFVSVDKNGLIDWDCFINSIRSDTLFVSVLQVNNETGVIQDLKKVAEFCQEHNLFCHVDGAQSLGKIAINLKELPIDLMSFSAHKAYGPKGIGALFVRQHSRVRLFPQMHGGGQEQGLRSGTLANHQIAGFGESCQILRGEMPVEITRIKMLRDMLWQGIKDLPGVHCNSDLINGSAHHLHISVEGVEGESLIFALDQLAVSSGSACTSTAIEPSHVLMAMGRTPALSNSSIRFSIGRFTTKEEIQKTIAHLWERVEWLRTIGNYDFSCQLHQ